jgi:polysaccharide export outer membrane protein
MSRAVLSVLLAIMPALCLGGEDPKSPSAGQTQPPPTQQMASGAQAGAGAVTPPQTTAPPAAPPAAATDAGRPAEAAPSPDANVPVTVPVDANTFVIGPEDELDIKVWEQPQLSGAVRVRSDGMITVPLLKNEIRAAGLTLLALRQTITEELGANALKDPQVTVNLLAAHSKKYYLYGQVKSPGEKELIMPTTILQAIVSAGGFLDFANQKDIIAARGDRRFKFNFKEVMAGKNLKQNIYLESGDIIYVK